MPAGLTIEVEADKAAIKAFMDALARYETATKRSMKDAVRSATIDLVRSLRALTRKSKKFIERMEISKSYLPPKWIMRGHSGRPLRRMQLMRWGNGTNWLDHRYVYGGEYVRGPRGGQRVRPFSEAQMRREAQRNYGQIRNWGLAKKSWGWFMKSLFRQSMQDENPRAKIDSRMVDAQKRESDTEYSVVLVNRLEYIREAMPPGAMSIALRKATNLINHKIESGLRSRRFRA